MNATPRAATGHRPPLGIHRVLGEGRGAALIRPDGEIDWWCPNRFEATPILWSLLDRRGATSRWRDSRTASWDGCPAGPTARAVIRCNGTRVQTWDGLVTRGGGSMLVRLVRAEDAPCEVVHELSAGGFDGPWQQWSVARRRWSTDQLTLLGAPAARSVANGVVLDITATPGEWRGFAIAAGTEIDDDLAVDELVARLHRAEAGNTRAIRRIRLPHDHPSRATDALRVLRALTDRDTGAPVASVTTSLPEAPGGDRQFDYRFSWLRDSALAVATAALLGQVDASSHYLGFFATLLDRHGDELPPVSTTTGERVPAERDVAGVAGWAASLPVRVGNDAADQRQLDGLASIIDAVTVHVQCGGAMTRRTWTIVDRTATMLADAPFGPSSGVWEFRTPRPLVTEELARWIGLDRALHLRRVYRPWSRRPNWVSARAAARVRVESAFDPASGLFRQGFDDREVVPDAYALNACIFGFFSRRDRRRQQLVDATIAALEEGSFLRRYPHDDTDGFHGEESAFLPASWWAVGALAATGRVAEAEARANAMCSVLPPLQAEEWSVERQESIGNTPLLWSHMESARALYRLQSARLRRRYGPVGVALWATGRFVRLRSSRRHRRPVSLG